MKQLIRQFKGLHNSADENDLTLEYGVKFHNCKVNQGYVESVGYTYSEVSSPIISSGICYLGDSMVNKYYEEEDKLVFDYRENYKKYKYFIITINNNYYVDFNDGVNQVRVHIGSIFELGEYKDCYNNKGIMYIYFEYDIVLIYDINRYVRRYNGKPIKYMGLLPLRYDYIRKTISQQVPIEAKLVNTLSDPIGRKVRIEFQEYPTNDNTSFSRVILRAYQKETNEPLIVKFDSGIHKINYSYSVSGKNYTNWMGAPGYNYELYCLRGVNKIDGVYKVTSLLVPLIYFLSYFEPRCSDGTIVPLVRIVMSSIPVVVYIDNQFKVGLLGSIYPYEFVEIPLHPKAYHNYYELPNLRPDDFLYNDADKNLVYKNFSIEEIGIENKKYFKDGEIIRTVIVGNDELFFDRTKIKVEGTPNDKYGIVIRANNKDLHPAINKVRYYYKMNNEPAEMIYEIDFMDTYSLASMECLITKRNLTGITLLNNTGVNDDDFFNPIIPDYIKKVNNLLIGYKDGEVYLPAFGNGKLQNLVYYNSRIVEHIKQRVITCDELRKGLAVFTEDKVEVFIIQGDKAGDIILIPSGLLPIQITDKFKITSDYERLFILHSKGILIYNVESSKTIGAEILSVIDKYYEHLAIVYNQYYKMLLLFSPIEKLIYIYDEISETWFSIDFNFAIKRFTRLNSVEDEVYIGYEGESGSKTILLRFGGFYKQSLIQFPKISFDDLKMYKYLTELIISKEDRTDVGIKIGDYKVDVSAESEQIKVIVPYQHRKPFIYLDLVLEFKGKIKTIQYNVEPAGESIKRR
jgi:hypothetical protein